MKPFGQLQLLKPGSEHWPPLKQDTEHTAGDRNLMIIMIFQSLLLHDLYLILFGTVCRSVLDLFLWKVFIGVCFGAAFCCVTKEVQRGVFC